MNTQKPRYNKSPSYYQQPNEQPELPEQSKPWYKSKTVLFNGVVAGVGVATSATPYIEPFVSTETFGLVMAGVGFANAALRFLTKKSLTKGGKRG